MSIEIEKKGLKKKKRGLMNGKSINTIKTPKENMKKKINYQNNTLEFEGKMC
jgi:DNA-binding CsgD family transcriptional regulator